MELRVHLSGSVIFATKINVIPSVGSIIQVRTTSYKKGLRPGSLVSIPVTSDQPPVIDYEEDTVTIDANGYSIIEEGPELD
jgi:hypothetical protein